MTKINRTIFIDLDCTLLDTRDFQKELAVMFKKFGNIDYEKAYRNSFECDGLYHFYSLEKHLSHISNKNLRKKVREAVEIVFLKIQEFLFPDVVIFLKKFEKDKLCLLTRGNPEFQQRKIDNLNPRISQLISRKYYVRGPKKDHLPDILIGDESDQVFIIDDDKTTLLDIKKRLPHVRTILLNRYGEKNTTTTSLDINCMANNLMEAGEYINGNCLINAFKELSRYY